MFVVQHKILKWGFSLCYLVFWLVISLLYGHKTWWMESSLDAEHYEGQFKVIGGHPRSNSLPLLYGHTTWWMESSLDAEHSEGQFKVIGVTQGQMAYHCCMDIQLGGWSHLWMLNILKVSSRSLGSPKVKWLTIVVWTCNLVDRVTHLWMLKILKVSRLTYLVPFQQGHILEN